MNLDLVCRFCLRENNLSPIFKDNNPIVTKTLLITTGLMIQLNDTLPQNMCSFCVQTIFDIIDFRTKCTDTEKKLISMLKDSQHNFAQKKESGDKEVSKNGENIKLENIDTVLNSDIVNEDTEDISINFNTEDKSLSKDNKQKLNCSFFKERTNKSSDNTTTLTDKYFKIEKNKVKKVKIRKNHCLGIKCENLPFNNFSHKIDSKLSSKNLHNENKIHLQADLSKNEFKTNRAHSKFKYMSREMVECDECNKKMLRASLKQHKRVTHAGIRPKCEHCGRNFGNKLRLTEHCRAKHGYDKLRCTECDFVTSSHSSLEKHSRLHTGEKPYVCEMCGRGFHAGCLLQQHRQSHRPTNTVKCTKCESTFKANNTLHTHMKTCHSDTSYICGVCKKLFSSLVYAKRHSKNVHGAVGAIETVPKPTENETPNVVVSKPALNIFLS